MISIILISTFAFSTTTQVADNSDTTEFRFDETDSVSVKLPIDSESSSSDSAFFPCVQIDLDGDGVPENLELYQEGCGTGGCEYWIHAGRDGRPLGSIFGDPIIVRRPRINGMLVIQTYSHASAGSGYFSCYVFDGKVYTRVSNALLFNESVDTLFNKMRDIPWLHHKN
jgi:hypothetical protein